MAEKILTSKAALEGERKQVTVLFADLKGSMELMADRDPEVARQLLDPVLERMLAAVHRYEGTVNQVMGDGIVALFGAPLAHEDHAVRACYAALAMQEAIRRYSDEVRRRHGISVQMRVGLNSGEVVVRAIGNDLHIDYSAIGQTVHLAARMEQLATPGRILLTSATLRLVEGLVQVHALGPISVKGRAEPVEVSELVRASALRGRLQAAVVRGLTRFVGRQQELAALRQTLERAESGHGQVVGMVGEAGVGKSRLLYEFIYSHHTPGWLVLESASVSYGKATPYVPVIDLLKRYAHVEEHDDLRTIRAKVVGQVVTLDAALQDTGPALLSLLDALPDDSPFLQLDPPQRRQRTLTALKRVLLRESQVQPVLLVCEDLHWIDAETQALLDSLVESLPTARLLLLVNYRPEYQHGWGHKTYYTQLRLDPLPPASADELLQDLLGDDPSLAPLKQLLIARTEGNPFFLEESVRTLVETRMLVGEPGAYGLVKLLGSLQVPGTVQAVLAARIDRLSAEEKRLLQTAAVIGTEVPWPLLQAIANAPEDALHRGLTHLQAAEFLYRLAHHALRGEVWDKVLAYGRQAGEKAMAHSAHREAVAYFEQALGALAQLPEQRATCEQAIDLRLALRTALLPSSNFERIPALLREAEALATNLDDPQWLAQVSGFLARHFSFMGAHDRALALAEELGMRPLVAHCHRGLGMLYGTLGQQEPAHGELTTAIGMYRTMAMTFWLPQAEAALAQVEGR
jgi:class 3 adenylate cyclase